MAGDLGRWNTWVRVDNRHKRTSLVLSRSTFAMPAAYAATTYEGNGQVPQQFVLSGKAADRLHDHVSINLDTAEKLVAACQAIAGRNNSAVAVLDPGLAGPGEPH